MPRYIQPSEGGEKILVPDDKVAADFNVMIDNLHGELDALPILENNLEHADGEDAKKVFVCLAVVVFSKLLWVVWCRAQLVSWVKRLRVLQGLN